MMYRHPCSQREMTSGAFHLNDRDVLGMFNFVAFVHPIRTLYPNKIIASNKLLGLLELGSGLGSGSGFISYA